MGYATLFYLKFLLKNFCLVFFPFPDNALSAFRCYARAALKFYAAPGFLLQIQLFGHHFPAP
jgi:hypothetical protein